MVKVIVAIWGDELDGRLGGESLRDVVRAAGASRLQVNISDAAVDGAMRISELDPPIAGVVMFWADGDPKPVLDAIAGQVGRIAAWEVAERAPLDPELPGDGSRIDALSNIAFLRRPDHLSYEDWKSIWLDSHTQVAIDTQATFGYYQNVVERPLTEVTPHVDAIVEELFPMAAVSDIHAFYGSDGDKAELDRRMTAMVASVQRFGADRHLDVVPTSRYNHDLGAADS